MPLTRLHEIPTVGDWFQILLCPNRTHICFLRDGTSFKFPQIIWTATVVDMVFSANSMTSKHLKTTMLLKFREDFWVVTISQNFDFWGARNFLRLFLPFIRLGSACGLASGCGFQGRTPLHLAAGKGSDSVVERLLEAKAAVDAKDVFGRGLRGGYWGGKPHEALGFRCEEVNEDVDGSWWFNFLVDIVFTIFWKACQNICTNVWCCCLWTQLYCSYTLGWSLFESRILVWK